MRANQLGMALLLVAALASAVVAAPPGYAIVASEATRSDDAWKPVIDALATKHAALGITQVSYAKELAEALPQLKETRPRYVCIVAPSSDAGRQFVADAHRLLRKIDDDPYTDARWGILTGYDAANALAIAKTTEPLEVQRVASGTEFAMDRVVEGLWYCELQQHRMARKAKDGTAQPEQGPADTTKALASTLNDYQADLFITSGHATERDWQIGFRYKNGTFRSKAGELFGVDTQGEKIPIRSDSPKVYLPIGNCLMGHIDGPDAMALAFMNSAGVRQMIGYTVLTWYGYAGWGCLDYFVEQPGRYTFSEAYLANEHALVHRLETYFSAIARLDTPPGSFPRAAQQLTEAAKAAGLKAQDGAGLLHDRDVLAFYGDPAWEARMAPGKLAYEQTLTRRDDGAYVFEIKPLDGEKSFEPVNTNGSQRGGRPMIQFLPVRFGAVEILEGQELQPVITDDFVLVPNPLKCDPAKTYRVVFRAK